MFALAWRNVLRHGRRSLITISAVAMGLASLLFLWGFNDGVHNAMMRNLQEVILGSVQVHQADFFKHPKLNKTVKNREYVHAVMASLDIARFSERLRAYALAAGDENSEGLILLGMNPTMEVQTTRIADKVDQGVFLQNNDTPSCVLGETTARNLGLHVGDEMVILTEDRFGSLAAEKLTLVGIISSGEMGIDRGLAIVPLGFMQRMLGMGDEVSEVVVQLPVDQLEQVAATLRSQLGPDYEVLRWYDMYPMMKQWVELENAFYYIFLSIVLVIVAAGIMNTVLMSMMERIHEFGVMMALGCSRVSLASMVVFESLLLGLAGVLAGTLLGLLLVNYFHGPGIDLSGQMDTLTRFYVDPVVHTEIDTDHLLNTILAVLGASALASLWPAVRASRLTPVEAMSHV